MEFFRIVLRKILRKQAAGLTFPRDYSLDKNIRPIDFLEEIHPEVSVILPFSGIPVVTFSCLSYLLKYTNIHSFEVIISDDNSSYLYTQMLNDIKNVHIFNHEKGLSPQTVFNQCATEAKGKYLVFLSNDIMVTQNWLHSLLHTLEKEKNVGVVGAKTIFPDGRFADAGGLVDWENQLLTGKGFYEDPLKTEFNYVQPVDNCSPFCFIVEKKLFRDMGMFETKYQHDICAFTDFACKVRLNDKAVVIQPHAMVVYFGNEKQLVAKREKSEIKIFEFLELKAKLGVPIRLVNQTPLVNQRKLKKHVLVVELRMITPDQDSASYRMFNMLLTLKDIGYNVTFTTINLDYEEKYVRLIQDEGIEVLYASPIIPSIEFYIEKKGALFDAIFLSRIHVANRLISHARKFAPKARIIFDTVDLHFLREERKAKIEQSSQLNEAAQRLKKRELGAAKNSDVTLVVSSVEKNLLANICPDLCVDVLSNIHEVFGSGAPFLLRKDILFIGGFEHAPNIDAMLYFTMDIFPLVLEKLHSDIKLYIVGSKPPAEIIALSSKNICVTGYVRDISPFFHQCRVFVSPLRYGAGVKGKINMSMSYGLPVVGTSMSVEGMFLDDGENVLVGDNPVSFADKVAMLYRDETLWNKISENSIKNVEKHFSRQVAKEAIKRILSGL